MRCTKRREEDLSDMNPAKPDDRGVFIVGCPRSGTTLLRVILDSHPQFCAPDESLFLGDMSKIVGRYWGHLETYGLERGEVLQNIRDFFLSFHHHFCALTGKPRWVEKTPSYEKHLEFINELFPSCKVIYVLRDGRDVAASHRENWGREGFFRSLYQWPLTVRERHHYAGIVGAERFLEVKYEELVSNPRPVLEGLMEFLEADWDNALLNSSAYQHVTKVSHGSDRPMNPVTPKKIGSWKGRLAWHERVLVNLAFRRQLIDLGYIGSGSHGNSWLKGVEQWMVVLGYVGSKLALVNKRIRNSTSLP